ncbi:MAG: hypothetical protein HQ567_34635 [Candidatus Nealsonbacteria bacterium]|nr:hypothetical protein [Candidatus Nealsonbacteria bacterium]
MVPAAIHVPVAAGELLDKITILQIKSKRISDENRLANVRRELNELSAVYDRTVVPSAELTAFGEELRTINAELWDIEDEIRRCEARKEFADRFVELAWAVYRTNDRRAAVKRQIDVLTGSKLVEEKQYESYE